MQVEGLLGLFGQRLGPHAPRAAAAVAAVATDMSLGSMSSSAAGQPPAAYARNVTLSERRTYRIPPPVALLGERLLSCIPCLLHHVCSIHLLSHASIHRARMDLIGSISVALASM